MKKVIIIGAGLSGIGAAYRFYNNKIQATIYEKNSYPGGNAASSTKNGFTFDYVPQVSFTQSERILNIFRTSTENKISPIKFRINHYWKGFWIKHPVIANLCGLPKGLISNIIREFFEVNKETEIPATNYKERLYTMFGKTFTDTFPEKFAEKYHTTSLANINFYTLKHPYYKPSLNEVIIGAISNETKNAIHAIDGYYPSNGGFINMLNKIISNVSIKFDHRVKLIDTKKKFIVFKNGKIEKYDYLISSMPLPELIKCIFDVPYEIQLAAEKLAFTSCVVVNIAVNRKNLSQAHQTYFYDHNIIFSKVTFPGMFSKNCPGECGTIQAEIYFSKKYKPLYLSADSFIEPTIFSLLKTGIMRKEDKILFREARLVPYANIIFDFERRTNLSVIQSFLKEKGISYCGQYGEWENKMTDEAFKSGEDAAQRVINQIYSASFREGVTQKLSGYMGN